MDLFPLAAYGLHRTILQTQKTADTFFRFNMINNEILADQSRTAFVPDVGFVLVSEIPERGQNGIGRCLPQAAQRTGFNRLGQVL